MMSIGKLTPLAQACDDDVCADLLSRSLSITPYALFEKRVLNRAVANACAGITGKHVAVLNIRLYVHGAHATNIPVDPVFIVKESDVKRALDKQCALTILSLNLHVHEEALIARQLRTLEMPLRAADRFGVLPVSKSSFEPPLSATPVQIEEMHTGMSLFENTTAVPGGSSVYLSLYGTHPVMLSMLADELRARERELEVLREEQRAREAAAKDKEDDDEEDEEGEVLGSSTSAEANEDEDEDEPSHDYSDDDDNDDMLVRAMESNSAQKLQINRCRELHWLRRIVKCGAYTVTMAAPENYDAAKFIARSRLVPISDLCETGLQSILFGRSEKPAVYIAWRGALHAKEAPEPLPPAPLPVLQSPAERRKVQAVVAPVKREAGGKLVSPPPLPPARRTWIEKFAAIDFDSVTMYEIEIYALARLKALFVVWHANEEKSAHVRQQLMNCRALKNYPRSSGAERQVLEFLGSEVLYREHQHEILAIGMLALTAQHSESLRDNLLLLEMMWYRHQNIDIKNSILADEDDNGGTGEEQEEKMRQHGALFEEFWERYSDVNITKTDDLMLGSIARSLAQQWQFEISEMNRSTAF